VLLEPKTAANGVVPYGVPGADIVSLGPDAVHESISRSSELSVALSVTIKIILVGIEALIEHISCTAALSLPDLIIGADTKPALAGGQVAREKLGNDDVGLGVGTVFKGPAPRQRGPVTPDIIEGDNFRVSPDLPKSVLQTTHKLAHRKGNVGALVVGYGLGLEGVPGDVDFARTALLAYGEGAGDLGLFAGACSENENKEIKQEKKECWGR